MPKLGYWALLTLIFVVSARGTGAQEKNRKPVTRPAPQFSGTFFVSDGFRRLTLVPIRKTKAEPFSGRISSACILQASQASETKPLDLSSIPIGTPMTVFYVPHRVGNVSENVILAVRFDHVPEGSTLPQGIVISCVKGS